MKSPLIAVPAAFDMAVKNYQTGDLQQAEQICRQIIQVDARHFRAFHLLGLIAHRVGRNDLAIEFMTQALRLNPNYDEAHNNLGILCRKEGRLVDAVAHYQQAIALRPDYAEAHNNLGVALLEQGRLEEAIGCYQEALRLRPNYADAYNNLGNALKEQGSSEQVIAHYQRALRLKPDYAEAHYNLGTALLEKLQVEEALGWFERAISLQPEYADAHWNRALAWLLLGHFEKGWPEYEWRWKRKQMPLPAFRQARWTGFPLEGRSILLYAEQGLGDTLQFIRYAPLVKRRGAFVIAACQDVLLPLVATSPGVDRVVALGSTAPDFDLYAPLLSLPGIFGTTLATVPAEVPYLFPAAELSQRWRQRVGEAGFKIGIAWQGNPGHHNDRRRSVSLVSFEPLARLDGVHLVSLQKGPGVEQLAGARDRFPIVDLGSRFATFHDTAAAIKNLDLVITVDSAVAHCAGALGVPVCVLLPFSPDWRWLLDRGDSPWYPTMRLFRQTEPGEWDSVFARVADEVKKITAAANSGYRP